MLGSLRSRTAGKSVSRPSVSESTGLITVAITQPKRVRRIVGDISAITLSLENTARNGNLVGTGHERLVNYGIYELLVNGMTCINREWISHRNWIRHYKASGQMSMSFYLQMGGTIRHCGC